MLTHGGCWTFPIDSGDYGAFRDLQRHRMCTIDWQALHPGLGADTPDGIDAAGLLGLYERSFERSAGLHDALVAAGHGPEAQYAVSFGHKVRFRMTLNAREAMHVLELRTTPPGHPSYRRICQQMHHEIAKVHPQIAVAMSHVNHSSVELERLESERRTEARLT